MKTYKLFDYIYILLTVLLTVYGQLIVKWRMGLKGQLPQALPEKIKFMFFVYLDPWMISAFGGAFLASVTWAIAMTKFQLSHVYPFTSLSYILVFFMSVLLFNESITIQKLIGYALIIGGIIFLSTTQK